MKRKPIRIFLAGASNTQSYTANSAPQAGWGQFLGALFKDGVRVVNHAVGGRSSMSFIVEGRLKAIDKAIGEGDYLFIHFGHNDASPLEARHTDPFTTYKQYLTQYVETARQHGAIPVLLTPVSKRNFDLNGNFVPTIPDYVEAVKQLGNELDVVVLDFNASSEGLYRQLGSEWTQRLFVWLAPGEHPNYPDGKRDNSHFNEFGAAEVAKLIIHEIKERGLPLAAMIKDAK